MQIGKDESGRAPKLGARSISGLPKCCMPRGSTSSALRRRRFSTSQIENDGRGIELEVVRAMAIERRLIAPGASGDKDLLNLIVLPGFSTAGVGMDAAKKQIDQLRGTLSCATRAGKGARLSITLPLTPAIIDGLLVQLGPAGMIVPMEAVTENVELPAAARARHNGRNVISVHGEPAPYIDLRAAFGIESEAPANREGGDRALREEPGRAGRRSRAGRPPEGDSVARPVPAQSGSGFGATIMGGVVALIPDIGAVVRHAERGRCRERAAA